MQVTPVLGILCALLILCILKEPARGQSEGVNVRGKTGFRAYYDDIIYCLKIPSYLLSMFGSSMAVFGMGGLAQWASLFMYKTSRDTGHSNSNTELNVMFGIAIMAGGLTGTVASSEMVKRLRLRIGASADCYVCALGLYVGSALTYILLTVASYSLPTSFVSISDVWLVSNVIVNIIEGLARIRCILF